MSYHLNSVLYAGLAFGLAFAGLPLYIHAPDYYAVAFGLSLSTLGAVLLFLRFIDAAMDPLIGFVSDHYAQIRWKLLCLGGVLLASGFWLVFNPPHWLETHKSLTVAWFCTSIFVCTMGFSIVSINYLALASSWKGTKHEHTIASSWREGFGLIGLLVASSLPTVFGLSTDPERAYSLVSITLIFIMCFSGFALVGWRFRTANERTAPDTEVSFDSISLGHIFKPLKTPWTSKFFVVYALSVFASSIPAVLVIIVVRDYLGLFDSLGLFLSLYFLSGVISLPAWTYLAKVYSKVLAWRLSMALAALTFVWAFFLTPGDYSYYIAICLCSGFALGADLSLPPSILTDRIAEYGEEESSARYFAIMTFLNKGCLALASGLALPILGVWGIEAGTQVVYGEHYVLVITYALIPSVLKFFVAWAGGRYLR